MVVAGPGVVEASEHVPLPAVVATDAVVDTSDVPDGAGVVGAEVVEASTCGTVVVPLGGTLPPDHVHALLATHDAWSVNEEQSTGCAVVDIAMSQ